MAVCGVWSWGQTFEARSAVQDNEMNEFQAFHDFNRLVEIGVAEPLLCQHCNSKLITRLKETSKTEIDLMLWCPQCDDWIKPGLRTFEHIINATKEVNE
jgi:hypothetical protein